MRRSIPAKSAVVFLLVGLVLIGTEVLASSIDPDALRDRVGKTVVFRELTAGLQRDGYTEIHASPDSYAAVRYGKYVGRKATVTGLDRRLVGTGYYWTMEFEDGSHLFAYANEARPRQIFGVYFVEDYEKASELIGKEIQVSQAAWQVQNQELITADSRVSHPVDHMEKVTVLGLETKMFGHAVARPPLFLNVRKSNDQEGMIGFLPDNFVIEKKPEEPSDKKVAAAIKSRNVVIGMTPEQVKKAWGEPAKTTKTQTEDMIKLKWTYDNVTLDFHNGVLTKITEKSVKPGLLKFPIDDLTGE